MTEINLFDADEPLRFKQILIYPYPDLKRLWVRIWLPAKDVEPNVELTLYNPDGTENNSLVLLAQSDTKLNNTFHLKGPIEPGATYHVTADLTLGFNQDVEQLDHREFNLVLEFRNPDAGERGFGVGLDEFFADQERD